MTTLQAITSVRELLDETGIEYFGATEVLMALEQAQIEKALEYRAQGRKDMLVALFRRRTLTGLGLNGIDLASLPERPLTYEACLLRLRDTDPGMNCWAKYLSPEQWSWYRYSNGNARNRSPFLHYTVYGGKLYHNGAGTTCEFVYYLQPMLPDDRTALLLKEPHESIVEMAAASLNSKEVIAYEQIGEPYREGIGGLSDIIESVESQSQRGDQ